jgi:hypothetical protein
MSTTFRRIARATVVLALGVVVMAGCGKSHSNGSSTVSPGSGGASTPASTAPSTPASSGSGGGYGY